MRKIKRITASALVLFTVAVCLGGFASADGIYDDVNVNDWFYSAVYFVTDLGIMNGTGSSRFSPSSSMTRGQIVTILARMSGDDFSGSFSLADFNDVSDGQYYADPVGWAVSKGIAKGKGDGRFDPDGAVLRQEFAAFFVRYMNYKSVKIGSDDLTDPFPDPIPAWAVEDVETLHKTGLVKGDGKGAFNPGAKMTRAEIATVVERFIRELEREPEFGPYPLDPTPDNIGVAYYDESSGIKLSYVRRFEEKGVPIPAAPGVGAHGGHETRIVRTPAGTYAAYITEATGTATDEHPLWHQGVATFSIVKITSEGFKTVFKDVYPQAAGSCTPNVLYGEDGKVYVTVICDNKDRYMTSMGTADFRNGVWLSVYEVDPLTDEVTAPEAPTLIDHETSPFQDHGYGYSQPILDTVNKKLYALICGGEGEEGYIAWFIYDLRTKTWDPECYTITVDTRRCYINGYPDGKRGFTFVIERCAKKGLLAAKLGLTFGGDPDTYLWDALYLYHVEDPRKEEYVEVKVIEPDYVEEGPRKDGKYYFDSVAHYGLWGCTYLDTEGRLHVICNHSVSSTRKSTVYHKIYTLDGELIFSEPIPTTLLPKNGTGNQSSNGFVMTQGKDGTYYVIQMHSDRQASIDVWSSPADDGFNFAMVLDDVPLVSESGEELQSCQKPIIANSRNHSVRDGIAAIMFHSSKSVEGGDPYYYLAVEFPG